MNTSKILIVDDHTMIRDGIRSILHEQDNYVIVGEASNGKIALEFIEKFDVDIVIMDINMPVLNGIECTTIISERYPSVRVLTLTMHDEELYLAKMMEAGAVGYILKDSGRDELLKAIEAIVLGKHYFSPEITINVIKELTTPSKSAKVFKNPLTTREQEILDLIVKEFSNQEIAEQLSISIRTVDAHRRNLLEKTGSRNTAGLVKFALSQQNK
jgi:DNA-binding NarL/FixJ family response regulator